MKTQIGCIAIIPYRNGGFIGLSCGKGRGLILPGGRWEGQHETFHECAVREAREEVGITLDPKDMQYIWHGPDGFGFTTLAFHYVRSVDSIPQYSTSEGQAILVRGEDLFQSRFGPYYRVLFDIMQQRKMLLRADWSR